MVYGLDTNRAVINWDAAASSIAQGKDEAYCTQFYISPIIKVFDYYVNSFAPSLRQTCKKAIL